MRKIGTMGKMKTMRTIKHKPLRKPKPVRTPESSSVVSHAYDPKTKHLTVEFKGGRKYRYEGVDPQTAAGLKSAASPGSYLHAHVIGNFPHTKI